MRENNAHMLPIEDPKWYVDMVISFLCQNN